MTTAVQYEKADQILRAIGQVFQSLMDEERLADAQIEKWRWDEPAITLTWMEQKEDEYIGKNIHALIFEGRAEIEVNAWVDKDVGKNERTRVRFWRHDNVEALSIPLNESTLRAKVKQGYLEVSSWRLKDLSQKAELSSMSGHKGD